MSTVTNAPGNGNESHDDLAGLPPIGAAEDGMTESGTAEDGGARGRTKRRPEPTESMLRRRRTSILVDGDPRLSRQIAASIEKSASVRLISGPQEVLVMNKVRESAQNSLFYLGEALLTECKVSLDSSVACAPEAGAALRSDTALGIGLILGENRERAYQLAVIDAAFNLEQPLPGHEQWLLMLAEEEARLAALAERGREKLDATRVEFSSMLTEEDRQGGAQ